MAITKAQILSDIQLQLLQSAPSDDSELSLDQVAFCASQYLNALISNEINTKTAKGEQIPSIYIKIADLEVPEFEDLASGEDRVFVELPEEVLTCNKDAGVVFVQTDDNLEIKKSSPELHRIVRNLRYAKPSEANMQYERVGLKLYIKGLKEVDVPFEKVSIWYVPKQDILAMEDDDEVLVSDLVLPELIAMSVQAGKLMLYGTQADTTNDGVDYKDTQYHRAIQNPSKNQPEPEQ